MFDFLNDSFLSTASEGMSIAETLGFADFGGIPSIGDIQADLTSIEDIVSGHGGSEDYGRGVGAVVGSFFGAPQVGANIGAKAFPVLKDVFSNIWDSIK